MSGTVTGKLAFCASARTGLGHLRRIANIAGEIRRAAPGLRLTLITNAPADGLRQGELNAFAETVLSERSDMARIAALTACDAVAVDTAVIPNLELLPQPLALILRETVEHRLAAFRLAAGRLWDVVLVAEPASHWTVSPAEVGGVRVTNVGWIYRKPECVGDRWFGGKGDPVLLVATGGGGSTSAAGELKRELEAVIDHVIAASARRPRVLQVLGPRASPAARLRNADAQIDVGARLNDMFASADVVLSTSGYNSILELAATSTPAVLFSVERTYDDQAARASFWGEALGRAHRIGCIASTASWISSVLESGVRRQPAIACPSGSADAAKELIGLVARARGRNDARLFAKVPQRPAAHVAKLSRRLFAAGVTTPPAIVAKGEDVLHFARLNGPTARDVWARIGPYRGDKPHDHASLIERVVTSAVSLHCSGIDPGSIGQLDPWAKINPRLAVGSHARDRLGSARIERVNALFDVARLHYGEFAESVRNVPVHGDFHLGQLISATGRKDLVLVDLDDIAFGPAEFDLANCAAHIATSPGLSAGSVLETATCLVRAFDEAYQTHSGRLLDARGMRVVLAVALMRRLLKLAEAGRLAGLDEILDAIGQLEVTGAGEFGRPLGRQRQRAVVDDARDPAE